MGGPQAWLQQRHRNLSAFCEPILRDVKVAMALQHRAEELARPRPGLSALGRARALEALPKVVPLKYDVSYTLALHNAPIRGTM